MMASRLQSGKVRLSAVRQHPKGSILAFLFWIVATLPASSDILYVTGGHNQIEKFSITNAVGSIFVNSSLPFLEGVAVRGDGDIFVSSSSGLAMYTPEGFGSVVTNLGASEFLGMAFDQDGNLFVVDPDNNTVQEMSPDGSASVFGEPIGLFNPWGLAFDSAGNLFVNSMYNDMIVKFTPDGTGSIFATNDLNFPSGLAFDNAGNLVVANLKDNTLVKFTPEGAGSIISSNILNIPAGMAFDSAGNLYVADLGNGDGDNRIEKFTPEGVASLFATTIFRSPLFIAITDDAGNPLLLGTHCVASLTPTNAGYSTAGGSNSVSVTISNDCSWTASSNDGFIIVTSTNNGINYGTVDYTVAPNTSTLTLTGTINIAGRSFVVEEAGVPCTFALGGTNSTVSSTGGTGEVDVITTNGCHWTAISNDSFITITSATNDTGAGAVDYSVAANASTNERSGSMTIAGQTFTVAQVGACIFTLNPSSTITFPREGGSNSVTISALGSNCSWDAVSDDPFLIITSETNGIGAGIVDYIVLPNTNTVAVSRTITIAGETLAIVQQRGRGCGLKVSPGNVTFKSVGGLKIAKVKVKLPDCSWTAVSNDPFITITSASSGVGDGTFSFSVAQNTNTNPLIGSITIGPLTVKIRQSRAK